MGNNRVVIEQHRGSLSLFICTVISRVAPALKRHSQALNANTNGGFTTEPQQERAPAVCFKAPYVQKNAPHLIIIWWSAIIFSRNPVIHRRERWLLRLERIPRLPPLRTPSNLRLFILIDADSTAPRATNGFHIQPRSRFNLIPKMFCWPESREAVLRCARHRLERKKRRTCPC